MWYAESRLVSVGTLGVNLSHRNDCIIFVGTDAVQEVVCV